MNTINKQRAGLPIRFNLMLAYVFSLAITLIMTAASIVGILYPSVVYPIDEQLQTYMPNEVVNLLIGVPILLGSMWLTRRGMLIGLLLWPGALLYVLYNYLPYVIGLPSGMLFLLYLSLTTLSTYTIIGLVANIDGKVVQQKLTGVVPEKAGGGVLVGLGMLMFLRAIFVLMTALVNQISVAITELSVLVADFIIAPAVIIGGVLLWRKKALGYVSGLGPILTNAVLVLTDVVVIFIMGLICFIPFVLYVRGVMANRYP
jgi:hypothetical protein